MQESPKAVNYRIFKENFRFEKYFDILDTNDSIVLCKFRTTNHKLPIEIGRWNNIERSSRICHLCDSVNIGDEYHYLLECNFFREARIQHLDNYYCYRVNILKMQKLMSLEKRPKLRKLCQFIKFINKNVCPPG